MSEESGRRISMKKELIFLIILNIILLIWTIAINVFGEGAKAGFMSVLTLDLCVTIAVLIRILIKNK